MRPHVYQSRVDDELATEPDRLRQQYLDALGALIDRYRIDWA